MAKLNDYQTERVSELIPAFVDAIKESLKFPCRFNPELMKGLGFVCELVGEKEDSLGNALSFFAGKMDNILDRIGIMKDEEEGASYEAVNANELSDAQMESTEQA